VLLEELLQRRSEPEPPSKRPGLTVRADHDAGERVAPGFEAKADDDAISVD
jgi:hypothetical protein